MDVDVIDVSGLLVRFPGFVQVTQILLVMDVVVDVTETILLALRPNRPFLLAKS